MTGSAFRATGITFVLVVISNQPCPLADTVLVSFDAATVEGETARGAECTVIRCRTVACRTAWIASGTRITRGE